MRLLLTLNSEREKQLIPINYQYSFSAVIEKADTAPVFTSQQIEIETTRRQAVFTIAIKQKNEKGQYNFLLPEHLEIMPQFTHKLYIINNFQNKTNPNACYPYKAR